jgi:Xaa-Pro aminopeptidase
MRDQHRRHALLSALAAGNLAALMCFAPEDVLLLSGYWPVMGSSLAVLTAEGALHVILPEDELELAKPTAEADFIPYKPETLDRLSTLTEALENPIHQLAKRLPLGSARVGVLLQDTAQTQSYQSANHFHSAIVPLLRTAYPEASVIAVDSLLKRMKSIKTDVELGQMRNLCRLAKRGFDAAQHAIVPGRREDEIAADVNHAYACVAHEGFERGHGYFFCMSGPNSTDAAGAFARTRRRVVQPGDLVMIHANTVGDGFWTDITRTYTAGEPTVLQQRMGRAIDEARSAALAAICPGTRASAVDAAARDVLTAYGFGKEFTHAVGHGVGFAAADPTALPRLHPKSPDVLEAGMTFNIEPAIYIQGKGGMRHCDLIACTPNGAEVLTDF